MHPFSAAAPQAQHTPPAARRSLAIIVFAFCISFFAWILTVIKLDPFESTGLALFFFFLSLFVTLTSLFTLLGFFVRRFVTRNEILYNHFNVSLRQGLLLSLCTLILLTFLLLGVLTWWDGFLVVLIAFLFEWYFSYSPR